jgi:hypothetical protein
MSPVTSADLFFFLLFPSSPEGRDPKAIGGSDKESVFSAAGIDPSVNAGVGASTVSPFGLEAGVDPNVNVDLGVLSVLLSTANDGAGAGVEPKVKLGL